MILPDFTWIRDRLDKIDALVLTHGHEDHIGGVPYLLRERPDAFQVFLYAPRAEKLRRLHEIGRSQREAEELVDTIDQDRITFVKHYFNADWPTRCLYHVMINTAIGDENVISTILNTMHTLQRTPAIA